MANRKNSWLTLDFMSIAPRQTDYGVLSRWLHYNKIMQWQELLWCDWLKKEEEATRTVMCECETHIVRWFISNKGARCHTKDCIHVQRSPTGLAIFYSQNETFVEIVNFEKPISQKGHMSILIGKMNRVSKNAMDTHQIIDTWINDDGNRRSPAATVRLPLLLCWWG